MVEDEGEEKEVGEDEENKEAKVEVEESPTNQDSEIG